MRRIYQMSWSDPKYLPGRRIPPSFPGLTLLPTASYAVPAIGLQRCAALYVPSSEGMATTTSPWSLWMTFGGVDDPALDWTNHEGTDFVGLTSRALPKGSFGLLLFDRPGTGFCEGKLCTTDRILQSSLLALRVALRQIADKGLSMPQSIGLIGHSLGCSHALELAAAYRGRLPLHQLILFAPFTTLQELNKSTHVLMSVFGNPSHRSDNISRVAEASRAHPGLKILLIHGESDTMVPPSMSQRLAAAMGPPDRAEVVLVPGGQHYLGYLLNCPIPPSILPNPGRAAYLQAMHGGVRLEGIPPIDEFRAPRQTAEEELPDEERGTLFLFRSVDSSVAELEYWRSEEAWETRRPKGWYATQHFCLV